MTNGGSPHSHGKKKTGEQSPPAQTAAGVSKKRIVPAKLAKKKKKV